MYRPVKRLQTPQNQIINLPLGLGTVEIVSRQNQPQNILGTRPIKSNWEQVISNSLIELEIAIENNNNKGTKGIILKPGNGLKPAPRSGQGQPQSTLDPNLPGEDPIIYPPGGWQPFPENFRNCTITIYSGGGTVAVRCYWAFSSSGWRVPYAPFPGIISQDLSQLNTENPNFYASGHILADVEYYEGGYLGDGQPNSRHIMSGMNPSIRIRLNASGPFEKTFDDYRFNPLGRGSSQLYPRPPAPATDDYNVCNDILNWGTQNPPTGKVSPAKITGYSMSCPFPIINPPTIEELNKPKWPSDIIDPGFPPNWLDDPRECDCMNCGCDCRQIADIMARQLAQIKTNHVETRDKNTRDTEKLAEFLQTQIVQATPTAQEIQPDLSPILEELKSIKDALEKGCDLEPILQRINEVEAFLWTGVKPNG